MTNTQDSGQLALEARPFMNTQAKGAQMIRTGVIGYGYWGPNIVRNFHTQECSEVPLVCDQNPKTQERLRKAHPSIAFTTDPMEVIKSPNIDAVAVERRCGPTTNWQSLRSRTGNTFSWRNPSPTAQRRQKS